MMWFWNFPLYMPQHPSSRAGRASQSPACGGLQVKLALSCKNLAVAETSGYQPPDPYAVLLASDSRGNWEEVSRTEVLQNSRGTVHTLRGQACCHLDINRVQLLALHQEASNSGQLLCLQTRSLRLRSSARSFLRGRSG